MAERDLLNIDFMLVCSNAVDIVDSDVRFIVCLFKNQPATEPPCIIRNSDYMD